MDKVPSDETKNVGIEMVKGCPQAQRWLFGRSQTNSEKRFP